MFKEVKSLQVIPSYLVQPLKANSSTHLAMSQMALLARLLRDLGTEGAGFTVDSVMRVSALGWLPQPGPSWWLEHVGAWGVLAAGQWGMGWGADSGMSLRILSLTTRSLKVGFLLFFPIS